uniref:Uncharacterized protein n=1 Tax=Glossina austeni TaxID=7395 RepID=A0A1A9V4J4_GLOAU
MAGYTDASTLRKGMYTHSTFTATNSVVCRTAIIKISHKLAQMTGKLLITNFVNLQTFLKRILFLPFFRNTKAFSVCPSVVFFYDLFGLGSSNHCSVQQKSKEYFQKRCDDDCLRCSGKAIKAASSGVKYFWRSFVSSISLLRLLLSLFISIVVIPLPCILTKPPALALKGSFKVISSSGASFLPKASPTTLTPCGRSRNFWRTLIFSNETLNMNE